MRYVLRFVWAVVVVSGMVACDTAPRPGGVRSSTSLDRIAPRVEQFTQEPTVRVRVARGESRVVFSSAGMITVGPGPGDESKSQPRSFRSPVTISRVSGGWLVRDATGAILRWPLPTLAMQVGASEGGISVEGSVFPGRLVLISAKHDPLRFDIINHVALETYLPGVLQRELFAKWHPAAYRAQAIAARSYALVQMTSHRERAYDLESTTASQVYAGRATRPRALDAVRRTRGLLLTYRGRVVEAFYSSTSGGMGQDAAIAFPGRVGWFDIAPLQGQRHDWGRSATYYQWGPVTRDTGTLSRRLAAWGRANDHTVGGMLGLHQLRIRTRSRTGRPAEFSIIDSRGRTYTLAAESFRFAANHPAPGLQPVLANQQLRSSNVQVRIVGRSVQFYNGRGYGHGVGLCQWSAQEMATRGHSELTILQTFYPQSSVRKAY